MPGVPKQRRRQPQIGDQLQLQLHDLQAAVSPAFQLLLILLEFPRFSRGPHIARHAAQAYCNQCSHPRVRAQGWSVCVQRACCLHSPKPPPRSSPLVEPDGKNVIAVMCTKPPVGGPWVSCNLTLCEQTRRRQLLVAGCASGAITTSCPFDVNGQAICTLGGLVKQNTVYGFTSIFAETSSGYTSEVGEQSPFIIPTFP